MNKLTSVQTPPLSSLIRSQPAQAFRPNVFRPRHTDVLEVRIESLTANVGTLPGLGLE